MNSGKDHITRQIPLRLDCLWVAETLACDISKFYTSVGDNTEGMSSESTAESPSTSISVAGAAQKLCDPDLVNALIDELRLREFYDKVAGELEDVGDAIGALLLTIAMT